MNDQLNPAGPPISPEVARIAERRALSRELHDDIAHAILIMMRTLEQVELHQDAWEPAALRFFLDARGITADTLERVRALAARLRGREDDCQVDPAPLGWTGDLPRELSYVLREAVANALAHAQARQVVVDVQRNQDRITAVVIDDGDGFEQALLAPHERVGLSSMRERIALAGGQLRIDTAQHGGTRVIVHIPSRTCGT